MKLTLVLLLSVFYCLTVFADEYHHHAQRKSGRRDPNDQAFPKPQEGKDYWMNMAQKLLEDEVKKERIDKVAKNVILFLGDGMSISTVTAARIYKGQKFNQSGEEMQLSFDKFPYVSLSRTYCTDAQVADSACTATAYLSGVKTDVDTLGLSEDVTLGDCSTQNNPDNKLDSIFTWAQDAGKGTGIVTTTRITHATPAAGYAHAAWRDWEWDGKVQESGEDPETCDDIAEQLINNPVAKNLKVILGGGRAYFLPNTTADPEYPDTTGKRLPDSIDWTKKWEEYHPNGKYVYSYEALKKLDLNSIDSLMGLFSTDHLEYFLESEGKDNPTLAQMTETAIKMLQKESTGFVLLVEGGRIDHAHHGTLGKFALEETLQFDLAVQAALDMTDRSDTLIVVTSDHSHTMTISGYPDRGNNILGLMMENGENYLAGDGKPFTTLSYANGNGYSTAFSDGVNGGVRKDLTEVDTKANDYWQAGAVPLTSETHGGDDVAIFAIGPQAHMFQGVYEQHYIAHVMAYAAGIGPGLKFVPPVEDSSSTLKTHFIVFLAPLLAYLFSKL